MSSWKCLDVSLVMIDHVQLEGLPSHLLGHDFSQPIMTLTPAGISPSRACLRLLAMSSYAQTCKSKKMLARHAPFLLNIFLERYSWTSSSEIFLLQYLSQEDFFYCTSQKSPAKYSPDFRVCNFKIHQIINRTSQVNLSLLGDPPENMRRKIRMAFNHKTLRNSIRLLMNRAGWLATNTPQNHEGRLEF